MAKFCTAPNCAKQCSFGPLGGSRTSARFCKTHIPKEGNWEDVVNKRCEAPSCKTGPSYGPVGGGRGSARFCRTHAPDLGNWEDVVSKRCEAPGCKVKPLYGPTGGRKSSARFCQTHAPDLENWEDVRSKRCEGKNSDGHACKKRPTFGPVGGVSSSARFCKTHVPDLEHWENVVDKRCAQDGCSTLVKEKYRGYCLHCFANLYPLEPVSRNYKTKERLVVQAVDAFLKHDFTHLEVTYDKQVSGGCSRRRPDIAVDVLTHVIIVECDEDGHNTEDHCTCENKRMMQLFQDYGNRPFVLIRFNPDAYVNSKGSKVASCFTRTKAGLVKVVLEHIWEERLRVLLERLRIHLEGTPEQEVTIEHLYYDGF